MPPSEEDKEECFTFDAGDGIKMYGTFCTMVNPHTRWTCPKCGNGMGRVMFYHRSTVEVRLNERCIELESRKFLDLCTDLGTFLWRLVEERDLCQCTACGLRLPICPGLGGIIEIPKAAHE